MCVNIESNGYGLIGKKLKRDIKPKSIEGELEGGRIKFTPHPKNFIAAFNQPAHFLNHLELNASPVQENFSRPSWLDHDRGPDADPSEQPFRIPIGQTKAAV